MKEFGLPTPRFFFDNNLSPELAAGMKAFGENVVHLVEIYPPDAKDEHWLPDIGQGGLTVVSRDLRHRKVPAEIAAIKKYSVGGFWLTGKNLTRCQIIQQVVRNWPQMKDLAGRTPRSFMMGVPPQGTQFKRYDL